MFCQLNTAEAILIICKSDPPVMIAFAHQDPNGKAQTRTTSHESRTPKLVEQTDLWQNRRSQHVAKTLVELNCCAECGKRRAVNRDVRIDHVLIERRCTVTFRGHEILKRKTSQLTRLNAWSCLVCQFLREQAAHNMCRNITQS